MRRVWTTVALVLLLSARCAAPWPLPENVSQAFDCAVRKAAYAYGKKLVPRMGSFESLYYALDLNNESCKVPLPPPSSGAGSSSKAPTFPTGTVFVSPSGDDLHHDGSENKPYRTIQHAIDAVADQRARDQVNLEERLVVLFAGTYFLVITFVFTSKHSNIKVTTHPLNEEDAVVSGGIPLKNVMWKPYDTSGGKNIYVANIKDSVQHSKAATPVPGLQVHGKRATRARYPNLPGGIEVSPGYDNMISGSDGNWTPPDFSKYGKVKFYTDNTSAHRRPDGGWFEEYMIGVGGLCSVYDPPVSYWCSEHPSGGGAFPFRTPSGVAVKNHSILPNSPYKDASQAIMFVWRPARWANWMFEIENYEPATNNFTFGKGGNQGARGNNAGGDFFIENVFEELDYPGEFFYNESTGNLFLYYNGTGMPPQNDIVVPNLQVLVNISGTQWEPVKDVTHSGVKFVSTSYTYMERHGVPSAGDWALDRFGAVYLQGTEGATFESCVFDRLDGNAVMISGYNRNATVSHSDFSYIGGNAMAAWGYTNETDTDPGRPGVAIENAPYAGIDGTDGNHPRYTQIISNTAREVGLYEKQSSFFVHAKTAETTLNGNVFFNGPRAGINFNDGFGGGDVISNNLVFSTCRESGDHGPFNSWDRQPFLTTVRTGKPSMIMKFREIHHNFFIDNYSPQENVDNDDGSAYYSTHDNFFVYATVGEKSDFGGHDNYQYDNIYAYVGEGLRLVPQIKGFNNKFYSNKAVFTGTDVGKFGCSGDGKTVIHDNSYFTKTGDVTECGKSLKTWQEAGNDPGSTVSTYPSNSEIIGWAKEKLGF